MSSRAAVAAGAGVLAVAGTAAGAGAAPVSPLPGASTLPSAALTFVPPRVGPISVDIGPTIIGGKIMNPGVHVVMPGASPSPLSWTPPKR
jgi:hypothetical protein